MPYHIEMHDGRHCVVKDADGERMGCHDSEAKAKAQMAAMHAAEKAMMEGREVRTLSGETAELRAETAPDGRRTIVGYAAVFDSWSGDLGGFREVIRPGAFQRSLASGSDVVALYNHDRSALLGRKSAGTLRLAEDARGLKVEIDPPDTTLGRDVAELIRRGDLRGMSFGFVVGAGETAQSWHRDNLGLARELRDLDLFDVTVATDPAYLDTSIAMRSLPRVSDVPPRYSLSLAEAELALALARIPS